MKLLSFLLTVIVLANPTLSELKILNTPDGVAGPPPCAITCSGVARHTDTGDTDNNYRWRYWRRNAYRRINFAECGFVTIPVVTATLSGYYGDHPCPAIYIRNTISTNSWFYVQTSKEATPSQMVHNKCDVYWIATGYSCWGWEGRSYEMSLLFASKNYHYQNHRIFFIWMQCFSLANCLPSEWCNKIENIP